MAEGEKWCFSLVAEPFEDVAMRHAQMYAREDVY